MERKAISTKSISISNLVSFFFLGGGGLHLFKKTKKKPKNFLFPAASASLITPSHFCEKTLIEGMDF